MNTTRNQLPISYVDCLLFVGLYFTCFRVKTRNRLSLGGFRDTLSESGLHIRWTGVTRFICNDYGHQWCIIAIPVFLVFAVLFDVIVTYRALDHFVSLHTHTAPT